MTTNEWNHEYETQTNYLRQQLDALHHRGSSTWRKFRLLEYVCQKCGDTVLEVMELDPYKVLRYRDVTGPPSATSLPRGASVQDHIDLMRSRGPRIRRGEWKFVPLADDLDEDPPPTLVSTACRCSQAQFTYRMIHDDLNSDRTKRIVNLNATS